MAATLSNELLLEILGGTANSSSRVETRELDRASPELLALLRGLASRTTQDRDKLKVCSASFYVRIWLTAICCSFTKVHFRP